MQNSFENFEIHPIALAPSRKRMDQRNILGHLIAINHQGTGQVTSMDERGLSFGCLYQHQFPDEWRMDILDSKGCHIKQLKVRKIWEEINPESNFEVEIGVEFSQISSYQQEGLDNILSNLHYYVNSRMTVT
ncbi:hypothetical protein [Desulfomarina sp.]